MWLFLTAALIIFVFAVFKFPRQTLYVLGGLIAIITAGALYLQSEDNKRQAERERREAGVEVSVGYDVKNCSTEYPLRMLISNGSSSVINSVNGQFIAFAPGRSSNLVEYLSNDFNSDRILQLQTMITLCYRLPKLREQIDPATLQWGTASRYISFAAER